MSEWRESRNKRTLERLSRRLPERFPEAVWRHALARPLIPVTLTKAVESYWRAHPLRADRLARALAGQGGAPKTWRWRIDNDASGPRGFRIPPSPYREPEFRRGPGCCCVCGEPVYRFGWHRDLWGSGPNRRAQWHLACVQAWKFWQARATSPPLEARPGPSLPRDRRPADARRGGRSQDAPLPRLARPPRRPWPELLAFWGRPNLQVINRPAHLAKCAAEAGDRTRAAGVPAHRRPSGLTVAGTRRYPMISIRSRTDAASRRTILSGPTATQPAVGSKLSGAGGERSRCRGP
jgi:hypothetical protein